jgi:hypothetical protein
MPENITPPPLGLEFRGKTFNNLGNSNTIAYKAYPRGWKFPWNCMDYFREFYGIISSRPKFLAVMAYKLCPKAQKLHGIVWIFHGNFME